MAVETTPELMPIILRCLIGSQAHGLARPDSDFDYREVFVIPTSTMLSLGHQRLRFAWQSQSRHTDDEGGYEIAEWLHLISKGAPNAVELCFAPIHGNRLPEGEDVQHIGRLMLSRDPVANGIIGYAMNSFRKIPENSSKWKAGMLRTLYQGRDLVETGSMSLVVPTEGWGQIVRSAANDDFTDGVALDIAMVLIREIEDITRHRSVLPEQPDYDAVNEWLLQLRKDHW